MTAITPFVRNLHRIRVLKVRFTKHLDALFESVVGVDGAGQDSEGGDSIPTPRNLALQEVTVEYDETSASDDGAHLQVPVVLELIDVRPIPHILHHSPNLSSLHLNIEELTVRSQHEDCERLLAALPSSLERLSLVFQKLTAYKNPVADDQTTNPWTPTTTPSVLGRLMTLTITILRTEMPVLLELLGRCPVLDELSAVSNGTSMAIVVWLKLFRWAASPKDGRPWGSMVLRKMQVC